MKRIVLIFALLLCTATIAAAQTKGKVSVGGSVTFVQPSSDGANSLVAFGPLVRLNPKRGWGVAAGLSWFRADIDNPSGQSGDFATLRVRPLMAGVSYTIGPPKVLTSFSIVAGPSFNSFKFDDSYLNSLPQGSLRPSVDIKTSFAVRPGVGLTVTVAPRVAVIGFTGYSFNRPDVVYRDTLGNEFRNQWKGDAFLLSAGVVFSLF
jgi:outer membrane protein with beta-barrel domain